MVGIGLIQTLSEGVGVALVIPFFYSVGQGGFGESFREGAPEFIVRIVDAAPFLQNPSHLVLAILGLLLLKNVLSYLGGVAYGWLDAWMGHELRLRVVERLLVVDLSVLESSEIGKLDHLVETHTYEVMEAVHEVVGALTTIVALSVFTTILWLISPPLTLLVGFCFAMISILLRWVGRGADVISARGADAEEELSQRTFELLRGMPLVRAFGAEEEERQRYEQASRRTVALNLRFDRRSEAIEPLTEVLVAGILIGILFTAIATPAALPSIIAFVLILYRTYPHVLALDNARLSLVACGPAVDRVNALFAPETKIASDHGTEPFTPIDSGIRFDDVRYRYGSSGPWVLNGVSFQIDAGSTTALVGPSGAGKSTVVRLLIRYAEPTSGRILVDDTPIDQIELESLRSGVALVSQESHVFDRSILENIEYGRIGASEAEIREAARRSHALEFIETLPDGIHTRVGDAGARLSGGQRQRIALARAILRKPQVLVLDEATSALDATSERIVQDSLALLGSDCTVLIIAHRLSTIRAADKIVVLDRGRVVEAGEASALLANGGLFARLWELQTWAHPSGTVRTPR